MTKFKGYLLMFGSDEKGARRLQRYLAQNLIFTPNQRTEAEAYRDANNNLHRITIDNHKTKIEFETIPSLTLEQKQEIDSIMKVGLINEVERKYSVTYWNDDINDYKTGEFYIPDTSYGIIRADTKKNILVYDSIKYKLIEY